ncbi:MAG: pilus assembly protein [Armatimonadetes bacterium]|nr:pilus assembly protein [Armatimonadota bacterium]
MVYRRNSGQALVEFALVASLLVLLMVGIFMFGQLLGWLHTLNNATRDAARIGAVCHDPDADDDLNEHIVTTVQQRTSRLPNSGSVVVVITSYAPDGTPFTNPQKRQRGGMLRVEVTYDAPVVPIPGILSSPRRLRSVSIFRVECDRN